VIDSWFAGIDPDSGDRALDLFVPATLSHREAVEYLHNQTRSIAHETGDVIREFVPTGSADGLRPITRFDTTGW
jgi:hypothetical protein